MPLSPFAPDGPDFPAQVARSRYRDNGRFERFEKAERARPPSPARTENDARAMERHADYLRGFGLPRENDMADALDREAMALREDAGRVGVAA